MTTKTEAKKVNTDGLIPELIDMLTAGMHFGHERSKRNPKMEPYIFMQRNRVAIIDLEKTQDKLQKAAEAMARIAAIPGSEILFVGTKRQARALTQKYAEAIEQPYVTKRWLGGTLTNFSTILKSIEKLDELKRTEDSEQVARLTKKEKSVRRKEISRLEAILEGIKNLKALPAAIFVAGSHDERIAVREARRVGIPIIGITDTNCNPDLIDYPIPANDDAIRSLDMIINIMAGAVLIGKGKDQKLPFMAKATAANPKQGAKPSGEKTPDETPEEASKEEAVSK